MAFLELDDARTWYDVHGDGEPVVLLHGGLTDSRDFDGNLMALANHFTVYRQDRRGHGRTPGVDGPLTLDVMAADTIALLGQVVGGPVRLVGYSAGAAVALRVAADRPELVDRLALISGAFDTAGMLVKPSADAEPPPQLVSRYAEVSPDGAEHFPVLVRKIADAVASQPPMAPAELGRITARTLVVSGDDDLVTLEHTIDLYRALADAQLAVVPETSHLQILEKPDLCTRLVAEFLVNGPMTTLMPIRRAR